MQGAFFTSGCKGTIIFLKKQILFDFFVLFVENSELCNIGVTLYGVSSVISAPASHWADTTCCVSQDHYLL